MTLAGKYGDDCVIIQGDQAGVRPTTMIHWNCDEHPDGTVTQVGSDWVIDLNSGPEWQSWALRLVAKSGRPMYRMNPGTLRVEAAHY